MPSRTKRVFFGDHVFNVWEDVYEPAEDTFLFAENLAVQEGNYILDMGTGCGILAVIAAKKASEVVAIDINPHAVRCARQNGELNGTLNNLCFIQGDMFTPLRAERFDLILFNTPYLPMDPEEDSWLERAWIGGVSGRQVIDRFICDSPSHLRRNGQIFLVQSTLSDVDETRLKFKQHGLRTEIVAKRDLPFFETIVLIKAEH
jgi:release factor glutamine methyltransferase